MGLGAAPREGGGRGGCPGAGEGAVDVVQDDPNSGYAVSTFALRVVRDGPRLAPAMPTTVPATVPGPCPGVTARCASGVR